MINQDESLFDQYILTLQQHVPFSKRQGEENEDMMVEYSVNKDLIEETKLDLVAGMVMPFVFIC